MTDKVVIEVQHPFGAMKMLLDKQATVAECCEAINKKLRRAAPTEDFTDLQVCSKPLACLLFLCNFMVNIKTMLPIFL